jgi:hypothetical protein
MRNIKNLILVVIGFTVLTCSPNCENITGVTFDDYPYLEEGEVLIKASNAGALQNKNVYFNEILVAQEDLEFRAGLGLIAKMPKGVTGTNVTLRIQDVDCSDFVSSSLNVQPASFFANNPDFIVPAPPQIIIPIPNPPLPPSINNAWISPDNKDYCIWFAVTEVTPGSGNYIISPTNRPDPITGQPKKTEELSVSRLVCQLPTEANGRYHNNPIYGMMNTTENKIQFWIDRSSKGLGVEEFEGQFIDINKTPYMDDDEIGPPSCQPGPWVETKLHMMMVVSKQTKRTLVLYQQLP